MESHEKQLSPEELEIARLRRELNDATKELESFAYAVSHDLRGPTRTILGYASILKEDYAAVLDSAAMDSLDRQVMAARRIEALVADVLKYSRMSRREPVRVDFDLSRLAEGVANEVRNRGWKVPVTFEIEPGLTANADPDLMRMVLDNLFDNAVKFSGPTGSATVQFGADGGGYFVRDRGVGFDMQFSNKLFVPFERLHRPDAFPGTGLGLAGVRKIIARHNGQTWAEGTVDGGATFRFRLG